MKLSILTIATALGSGLIGGVFFAFSNFIMKALARGPAAESVRAMNSINVTVLNGFFLAVFVGTALVGGVLVLISVVRWQPGSALRIAGCLVYIVGTFGVTMWFNVPRNNALKAIQPEAVEAAAAWARYYSEWTMWNTVRTIAAVVATGVLTGSLLCGRGND